MTDISVILASEEMKPQLHTLLQDYLSELSQYDEIDTDYPYFDDYWQDETRWPFLILAGDRIAGFALINQHSPSGLGTDYAVAEFYILPLFRKTGTGSTAFRELLKKHKGTWEISIMADNQPAQNFWSKTIAQVNIQNLKQILQDGETIYRFITEDKTQ